MTELPVKGPAATGLAFAAYMVAAGALVAVLAKAYPGIGEAVPALMGLLILAFPFDIAAHALAVRGTIAAPLAMPWRIGGFIAGAAANILVATYAL